MTKLGKSLLGLAIAVFSVLTLTTPAQAGTYDTWTISYSDRGRAFFEAYDEHLAVTDSKSDGYGIVAVFYHKYTSGNFDAYYNTSGYGVRKEWNLAIPENTSITIDVCLTDNGMIRWSLCKRGTVHA